MKTTLRKLSVTAGALVIVAMMTATAHAGCGDIGGKALKRQAWQRNDFGSPALRLISAADNDPITGMWKTTWTVGTTTIDSAFSLWHADGTEINNSGARAPITGNFCIGIWKNIGKRHYKLNHEGISWDPTGTIEVGVANITQNVVLGPAGDQFEGTFTITQYDMNGDVLQSVSGNIKGVRINIDTVINTL
jgi:hypothetical protein